jgi:hypothetical protein
LKNSRIKRIPGSRKETRCPFSEDKKVINLLYIDQLNQDYDNPILRKELIALSAKERLERQCQRNHLKADSGSETNDKDYVFSILF